MQPQTDNSNQDPAQEPAQVPNQNLTPNPTDATLQSTDKADTPLPMPAIGGRVVTPVPITPPSSPVSVQPPISGPSLETFPVSNLPVEPLAQAQTQPIAQPVTPESPSDASAPSAAQGIPPTSTTPAIQDSELSTTPNVIGANLPGSPGSGTMFVGGDSGLQTVTASGSTKLHYVSPTRKKAMIGGGVAAGVTTLAALFLFVFYIPNLPTNVWNTGMSRTGKEMTALLEALADQEATAGLAKSKYTVNGSLDMNGKVSTINIDTTSDDTKTNTSAKVNVNVSDMPEMNLTADVKTQLPENAFLPNIYFKVAGFSNLGLDAFLPGINTYDNKWIAVEQDYLKQFEDTLEVGSSEGAENITEEDVLSIANDVNEVSQEYLFTSDPEKAVIVLDEFIATEESEGIKANHYKASIDKENAQDYCVALRTKLLDNKVVKDNGLMSESSADDITKYCKSSSEDTNANDTFDVWIDKKYKLLHKVRFYKDLEKTAKKYQAKFDDCIADLVDYEAEDTAEIMSFCDSYKQMIVTGEAYTEFGQVYNGKDTFLLFVGENRDTNREEFKLRLEMNVDIKKLALDGKMEVSTKTENSNTNGKLTISSSPYEGEIDATKPESAISIQQAFGELMGSQLAGPDYYQMSEEYPELEPVTSQLNLWKTWLQ